MTLIGVLNKNMRNINFCRKLRLCGVFIYCLVASTCVSGFSMIPSTDKRILRATGPLYSTEMTSTQDNHSVPVELDSKEVVKVFGRIAEKYIMLDASGGMCCYSACKDCEYRLPGGGYIMADQSASRPKWIPCYDERTFESSGKHHISAWSQSLFVSEEEKSIDKSTFLENMENMDFVPPLTSKAPYLSASAAKKVDDLNALEQLWNLLNPKKKETLTKRQIMKQLKVLAKGEEGWTWNEFNAAMTNTPLPE